MMRYLSTENTSKLNGKTVLLRLDLNVTIKDGNIIDDQRIASSLPTIDYLLKAGCCIIICSHLGRPDGKLQPSLTLKVVHQYLIEKGYTVDFYSEDIRTISILQWHNSKIIMLENLRFYAEEETNEHQFAKHLASFADVYVNDAFACCHRSHASIDAVTLFFQKDKLYAGLLIETELTNLAKFEEHNIEGSKKQEFVVSASRCSNMSTIHLKQKVISKSKSHHSLAIIGGKKVSSKFAVLKHLVQNVDYLFLAGGMANTFLAAYGYCMGSSYVEKTLIEEVRAFLSTKKKAQILLPADFICLKDENVQLVELTGIRPKHIAMDIGEQAIRDLKALIDESNRIIWNGPLGAYEDERFCNATTEVAHYIGQRTISGKCISIAGGGDVIAALNMCGETNAFSYISTAGGAFLEWLEGRELPGLKCLGYYDTYNMCDIVKPKI